MPGIITPLHASAPLLAGVATHLPQPAATVEG